MSVISELVVLIQGNNTGLLRGLREGERAVDGFAAGFSQRLQTIGGGLTQLGGRIAMLTAPLAVGMGAAVNTAMDFDRALTNVGAVLGRNRDEMAGLRSQILEIGETAQAGPQAVAQSMYEIASGVADASTHMGILNAAVATSEAGAASLTGTTSALVSMMNSYGFSADGAARVSDILPRTVAVGVSSMDDFASALPTVTGMAAPLGVSLEQVGAAMSFLTTKGFTASQSATYLRQAMVALLNPNSAMEEAFKAMGIESGSAAIRTHGLASTLTMLNNALGGNIDTMQQALGSQEAMQAALALTGEDFTGFATNFMAGIEGATAAARELQQESPAYQFDLLKAKLQQTGIVIGQVLLPAINRLYDRVKPMLDQVTEWITANPQLAATIAGVAAAAVAAGPIIAALGTTISTIGLVIGALTSPVALIVAGIGVLATVLGVDLRGGFEAIVQQAQILINIFNEQGLVGVVRRLFATFEDGSSTLSGIFEGFGMARENAESLATGILETVQMLAAGLETNFNTIKFQVEYALGSIWERIRPVWETLRDWFTGNLVPALTDTFENHIMPAVRTFGDFLSGLWEIVRPHLERLAQWFTEKGLPDALNFITEKVVPIFNDFIDLIGGIWKWVSPGLLKIADWFLNSGLPAIVTAVQDAIGTIQELFEYLSGNAVNPNVPVIVQPPAGTVLPYEMPTSFGRSAPKMAGKGGAGAAGGGVYIETINLYGDQSGKSKDDFRRLFTEAFAEMAG